MGIEQRPNVERMDLDQEEAVQTHAYRIKNPDGSYTGIRTYSKEQYAYAVYGRFSGNANSFFQEAESITRSLALKSSAKPKEKEDPNFYYGFFDQPTAIELPMNNYSPLKEMEDTTNLQLANLRSSYGNFGLERIYPDDPLTVVFATHIHAPEEIAEFFAKYSSDNVDTDGLISVLRELKGSTDSATAQ